MNMRIVGIVAAGALAFVCPPVLAQAQAQDNWLAVPAEVLDQQRGGFTTTEGLQVALGVERIVSINGVAVSQVSLQAINAGAGPGRLIQQGGNNFFAPVLDLPGATFVQNTLNGQTIRVDTQISASVNSGALMRELNFLTSLRDVTLLSGAPR